jgi:SAM-dependent methyltransferase
MKISLVTGAWVGDDAANYHEFDQKLAYALTTFLVKAKAKTVVDLGCGTGHYTLMFINHGLQARGYDANPSTPLITGGLCQVANLAEPLTHIEPADWAVCLEVGEHVPAPFEGALLDNIGRLNRQGVLLSWAVPGQGGEGHFNELPNDVVKERFLARGYTFDAEASEFLRSNSEHAWFATTLMVFRR